jgi:hypothetical protein
MPASRRQSDPAIETAGVGKHPRVAIWGPHAPSLRHQRITKSCAVRPVVAPAMSRHLGNLQERVRRRASFVLVVQAVKVRNWLPIVPWTAV